MLDDNYAFILIARQRVESGPRLNDFMPLFRGYGC